MSGDPVSINRDDRDIRALLSRVAAPEVPLDLADRIIANVTREPQQPAPSAEPVAARPEPVRVRYFARAAAIVLAVGALGAAASYSLTSSPQRPDAQLAETVEAPTAGASAPAIVEALAADDTSENAVPSVSTSPEPTTRLAASAAPNSDKAEKSKSTSPETVELAADELQPILPEIVPDSQLQGPVDLAETSNPSSGTLIGPPAPAGYGISGSGEHGPVSQGPAGQGAGRTGPMPPPGGMGGPPAHR